MELLDSGWNRLADPADPAAIITAMSEQLTFDTNNIYPPLYGDGYAAEAIVRHLQGD